MGKKRNRVGNKTRLIVSIIIFLAAVAACAVIGFTIYLKASSAPVDAASTDYVTVNIPSGSSTSKIGEILDENGLLKNASMFKLITRIEGCDGRLKAGEYTLSPSMTVPEILGALLLGGNADTKRFTIPEGYTLEETADKLERDGFVDRERFISLVENGEFSYEFMNQLPAGPDRLEGFLFPETYEVFAAATEEDIINRMLSQFDKVYEEEYYARAAELGYSLHEIITIASLIEAETRAAAEQPVVASVIYNRLSIGQQLQIDATVKYAHEDAYGETKERILLKDLEIEHPYNTYKIPGIPPGPICSPGAGAIHAALYPTDTEYFYYVLKPDKSGEHNFSKTLAEHNRYAREYHNSL